MRSSILYIFAINIIKRWIYYITATIREQMTWKAEKQESIRACYTVNSVALFTIVCSSSMRHILCLRSLQSIRTRRLIRIRKAQIRKVWNNIRSRNQYRSAASASILLEISIDSSYKYSNVFCSRSRSRFSTRFSFALVAYIYFLSSHFFCFRIYFFTFIAFALRLSASTMICHDIYASVNEFLRNVDRSEEMR